MSIGVVLLLFFLFCGVVLGGLAWLWLQADKQDAKVARQKRERAVAQAAALAAAIEAEKQDEAARVGRAVAQAMAAQGITTAQGEPERVGAAVAAALVERGVTVAERCVRCGQIFIPDARGGCTSCGAPPAVKP